VPVNQSLWQWEKKTLCSDGLMPYLISLISMCVCVPCIRVCVLVSVCLCVCVRKCVRERETERDQNHSNSSPQVISFQASFCSCCKAASVNGFMEQYIAVNIYIIMWCSLNPQVKRTKRLYKNMHSATAVYAMKSGVEPS